MVKQNMRESLLATMANAKGRFRGKLAKYAKKTAPTFVALEDDDLDKPGAPLFAVDDVIQVLVYFTGHEHVAAMNEVWKHFFNPPYAMNLVEVIKGYHTSCNGEQGALVALIFIYRDQLVLHALVKGNTIAKIDC